MNDITQADIVNLKKSIERVLSIIPTFQILDNVIAPEGLKPIARSISWIVEQVVIQNLRQYKEKCEIETVIDPPHDLTQYDCIIKFKNVQKEYYVNLKTSLTSTTHTSRFDISKARKLIQFYKENPGAMLFVVVIKVEFNKLTINFKDLIIFNVACTPDVYYNRANHNLQSKCDGTYTQRTNEEFVNELEKLVNNAGHSTHY